MAKIINVKTSKKDALIDHAVLSSINEEQAWEKGTEVHPKSTPTSIRLSTRTIQKAKFFARIHHERGYQSWLKKIVEERIDSEYELYKRIKQETI